MADEIIINNIAEYVQLICEKNSVFEKMLFGVMKNYCLGGNLTKIMSYYHL